MTIFHGVEAIFLNDTTRSVRVVNTAITFIVGSAPIYALSATNRTINQLIRVASDVDDSLWVGPKTDGFTLPTALDIIRNYGGSDIEIVNVFDPATHNATATDIAYTIPTSGTVQLERLTASAKNGIKATGLTAVTVTNTGGATTYVLDTDYSLDTIKGTITRLTAGAIPANGNIEVTYTYADPNAVTLTNIIGAVTDGVRTGLQMAFNMRSLRGYRPKVIICPGFSESSTVSSEMETIAENIGYGCIAAIDAPVGVSVSEAKAGRAGTAPVTNFGTSNPYTKLFYPRVKFGTELQSLATHYAGLRHFLDDSLGYHYSASNYQLKNVDGIELTNLSDADRESLNIDGITTLYRDFGTGIRIWGNHTAQYPSDQNPYSFEGVYRAVGIIHEALVEASLPFVDKPITSALAQVILETANGFLSEQQARNGAVVGGSEVRYLPTKNPATQLAAGTLVFTVTLMIPVPAQVIRYETNLNISLLSEALTAVA